MSNQRSKGLSLLLPSGAINTTKGISSVISPGQITVDQVSGSDRRITGETEDIYAPDETIGQAPQTLPSRSERNIISDSSNLRTSSVD